MKKPMVRHLAPFLIVCAVGPALAQQSASYRLEQGIFNSGGHPGDGVTLISPGYHLTLDALGDGLSASNLGSPSYLADTCFVATYAPPGEVANFHFGDATTLLWDAERSVGRYNVYRAPLTTLPGLGYGSCLLQGLIATTAADSAPLGVGQGFFYLTTAENRREEEGTKGFDSFGNERPNAAPCP